MDLKLNATRKLIHIDTRLKLQKEGDAYLCLLQYVHDTSCSSKQEILTLGQAMLSWVEDYKKPRLKKMGLRGGELLTLR